MHLSTNTISILVTDEKTLIFLVPGKIFGTWEEGEGDVTMGGPEPFGEVPGWLCPVSQSLSSAEMVDIFMYLVFFILFASAC